MWFDAHVHLADERLRKNWHEVVARSVRAGVTGWVEGGIHPENWQAQRVLKDALGKNYLMAFGLHPWWVAKNEGAEIEVALDALRREMGDASALGEMGLDYSPKFEKTAVKQKEVFRRQLDFARAAEVPVVLHVVKAHGDALTLLESEGELPAGGIVHSFSGSWEVAERYQKLGLMLSLSGSLTFPGHEPLKAALPRLQRDRLLLETDTPDQLPRAAKMGTGILNEPAHLPTVAEAAGELLKEKAETLLNESTANLRRLFKIEGE